MEDRGVFMGLPELQHYQSWAQALLSTTLFRFESERGGPGFMTQVSATCAWVRPGTKIATPLPAI
eukprot:1155936-Pelagomonas_calceolata.AAC.2